MLKLLPITAAVLLRSSDGDNVCSRDTSRKLRNYLVNDVFPTLKIDPQQLPLNCPFNPNMDLYREQELRKEHTHGSDWQCLYCRKRFVNEFYLDRHMERRHSDMVSNTATVCLADYCPMFGCKHEVNENRKLTLSSNVRNVDDYFNDPKKKRFGLLERCNVDHVNDTVSQCRELSDSCFGTSSLTPSGSDSSAMQFANMVCNQLKCVNGVLKGGPLSDSILKIKKNNDTPDSWFVLHLLRIMALIIIVFLACAQVVFSGNLSRSLLTWVQGGSSSRKNVNRIDSEDNNYLKKYHQQQQQQQRPTSYVGMFVYTIMDACQEARVETTLWIKNNIIRRVIGKLD